MADQDDPVETERLHHRPHVLAEGLDRPGLPPAARLPVAREVERHHPVVAG